MGVSIWDNQDKSKKEGD